MPAELFRRGCLTFTETFSVAVFCSDSDSVGKPEDCESVSKPNSNETEAHFHFHRKLVPTRKEETGAKKKFGRKLKLAEFNGSSDLVPCPWQRGSVVRASVTSVVTTPLGVNGWPKTMDGE